MGPALKANARWLLSHFSSAIFVLISLYSRISEIDDVYIKILEHMSKIPAAFKSWRSPATDVFADAKFFSTVPGPGLRWRAIVKALIDIDKTAFGELLGKPHIKPTIYAIAYALSQGV